jgi:hypothetical protein
MLATARKSKLLRQGRSHNKTILSQKQFHSKIAATLRHPHNAHTHTKTDRQTDQTDRHTERQTDRHTQTRAHKPHTFIHTDTNGHARTHTYTQNNTHTYTQNNTKTHTHTTTHTHTHTRARAHARTNRHSLPHSLNTPE